MLIEGIEARTIPGFPNYAVSEDGQVWSIKRWRQRAGYLHSGLWLKPIQKRNGYLQANLYVNGKMKIVNIHTVVLEAYVGPRPSGMQCRHLNGNPADNRLENLAWGTPTENQLDRNRHGTGVQGEKHPMVKLTEQDIRMIIYMYRTGLFSQVEIASIYQIHRKTVGRIILKKSWKHIWN